MRTLSFPRLGLGTTSVVCLFALTLLCCAPTWASGRGNGGSPNPELRRNTSLLPPTASTTFAYTTVGSSPEPGPIREHPERLSNPFGTEPEVPRFAPKLRMGVSGVNLERSQAGPQPGFAAWLRLVYPMRPY